MCGCIADMDNVLREHNTCLVTTMFRQPEVVAIRTDKVNTRLRKGPATVIASYCPFCGAKYGAATGLIPTRGGAEGVATVVEGEGSRDEPNA